MNSLLGTAKTAWSTSKHLANVPCRQYGRTAVLQRRAAKGRKSGPIAPRGAKAHAGPRDDRRYDVFRLMVESRLSRVLSEMGRWDPTHDEYRSFGLHSQSDLNRESSLFRGVITKSFDMANQKKTSRVDNPLFWNLRNAYVRSEIPGLMRELKYAFQTFILRSKFPKSITDLHRTIADFRHPWEWYPATRQMQRTIHLHVGPTNSGKTYRALKALEGAKTGVYAGPLRLLAHEVYTRFQAKGKPIALVTGEEQRIPSDTDQYFQSCTVEMAPLNMRVDVAVIDEIQMLADPSRGWAWTQAFLGMQAKELHLCGEERVVDLIRTMCARMGDTCIVHKYKRLNPLSVMTESLDGKFSNLQKGDALVAFSRIGLHRLKAGIESATGRKCAIVYGALPPETRAQQAALFNDPNNDYDFLVASDAIGMGLNLEIRRVIFESGQKFDGLIVRDLNTPEIKQIGGRAGRFRTASEDNRAAAGKKETAPKGEETAEGGEMAVGTVGRGTTEKSTLAQILALDEPVARLLALGPTTKAEPKMSPPGFITTLDTEDLKQIRQAFTKEPGPITTSGILPPAFALERFYSFFPPNTPFSFVLSRLRELSRLTELFHMCDFGSLIEVAEAIQEFPMSITDRCLLLSSPVNFCDYGHIDVMKAFARAVSQNQTGHLLSFKELDWPILEISRENHGMRDGEYLKRLESLHKAITLYLWLTYRFDGIFVSQHLAFHVKDMVEVKIAEYLDSLHSDDYKARQARRRAERARSLKYRQTTGKLFNMDEEGVDPDAVADAGADAGTDAGTDPDADSDADPSSSADSPIQPGPALIPGPAMIPDPAMMPDPAKAGGESAVVH